jgi:alanine racemase
MITSSRVEISKKALARNIRFLRKKIGKGAIFSSVIKGNAYGHCIEKFVPLAESCGIRHFTVFGVEEAVRAEEVRTEDSHIMITGFVDDADLEWPISRDISFYVFDMGRLQAAAAAARKAGRKARIHLELETGLNRTGFGRGQFDQVAETVRNNGDCLQVDGICTHYAGAESIGNFLRITNQIKVFREMTAELEALGVRARIKHTACSAAAMRYPDTIMDLVRFGIAQYGYWPSRETRMQFLIEEEECGAGHRRNPLRRVLTWKSRIMSVKEVAAGQYVGYGTVYQTGRRQKVATVPVGYYQGFARSLSNLGHVLVRGKRAPCLGFVSMNVIIVDVSSIPDVSLGDEVVIIGRQGKNEITVNSFSEMSRNLNYEVLVRIPSEIPRVVVN